MSPPPLPPSPLPPPSPFITISEILDTPDFFWKEPAAVEEHYRLTMRYLEMDTRTEILNKVSACRWVCIFVFILAYTSLTHPLILRTILASTSLTHLFILHTLTLRQPTCNPLILHRDWTCFVNSWECYSTSITHPPILHTLTLDHPTCDPLILS